MPNWCHNVVVFRGDPEECRAFRELMGEQLAAFDFNAVAPMPPELEPCNTETEIAYEIKYGEWESVPWWGAKNYPSREAALQAARHPENADRWGRVKFDGNDFPSREPQSFDEAADTGYANVLKHGYAYWYGWAIEHWGTKWNTSPGHCSWAKRAGGEGVEFRTAWSPPVPVLERLAERFPTAEIQLEYSEPEMAFCGTVLFSGGVLTGSAHHDGPPPEAWPEVTK